MIGTYRIVAGPSREELFDALRLRHEGKKVEITVIHPPHPAEVMQSQMTITAMVDMIKAEDGTGDKWLLELSDMKGTLEDFHFKTFFNTKTRTGTLTPCGP